LLLFHVTQRFGGDARDAEREAKAAVSTLR